ncbi:MAG: VCBS repeat-containing protein [Archangiaceae bacterium]|nr:VCBS repeat-containing protein [Archangiaceae bacterium]
MIGAWLCVTLIASAPGRPNPFSRAALDELAFRIVEQAEGARPEAPVGVYVEGGPPVLARAFASAVSAQLAARRRGPSVLEASSAAEAEALARTRDVRTLLRLTVQLDGQKLLARGDAVHTWVNFWSGASSGRGEAWAALAGSVDADAQALALGAAPSPPAPSGPLKLALTSFARLASLPAALAFGDLDGDGKGELAVLLDEGVSVFDADGHLKWKSELRDLPAAASPSREPYGALAVLPGPPRLLLASSRKARQAVLVARGQRLELSATDAPLPVDGALVRPLAGMNVLERQVVLGGKALELPAPPTALSVRGATALLVYPDGTAMLLDGAVPATHFSGAGAASTLADLDADGSPELLLSSTRYAVDGDPLVVLSLAQAQQLQARAGSTADAQPLWQGATPRGRAIVALGADLDGDKAEEVVLGIWLPDGTGELLVAKVTR